MGERTAQRTLTPVLDISATADTPIVVDLLRGYKPAQQWFRQQQGVAFSRVVWFEVLQGARNGVAQARALRFLRAFPVIDITPEDSAWASEKLVRYRLSHGVHTFDCPIAAVAARRNITVYTRNLKHFVPLVGALAVTPY